jgi:Porin PorA
MRTRSKALIAVGATLAVLAGLWALIAPGQLVKYPTHVDKTVVASGKFSLAVNPSTGTPLSKPEVLPLTIHRRLRVVSSTGSQAVVKENDLEQIGTLPQQDVQQRYVLDRSSLQNVAGGEAYAYTPATHVNRSSAFSVNLPFGAHSGPYQVWKNEVGRSYTFRQQGGTVSRDGVTLIPFQGEVTDVPAQSYYLATLAPLGHLPTRTTIAQLTPQLKALGINPAQLQTVLLPQLSAPDRAAISSALSRPIPLRYVVSAKTRILVEPTTGIIVSLDRINESLGVQPQLGGLSAIATVLGKSAYRSNPVIAGARNALAKLSHTPATATVFSYSYGQTPASVADIAAYAKSGAQKIKTVETTIPLGVLLLGVLSAATGLILWRRERSGEGEAPSGESRSSQTATPDATPETVISTVTVAPSGAGEEHPETADGRSSGSPVGAPSQ